MATVEGAARLATTVAMGRTAAMVAAWVEALEVGPVAVEAWVGPAEMAAAGKRATRSKSSAALARRSWATMLLGNCHR